MSGNRPGDSAVTALRSRPVYDSQVGRTVEFEIELDDGAVGAAAPARGETVGLHEDTAVAEADRLPDLLARLRERVVGQPLDQTGFDALLEGCFPLLGRSVCSALSEAFFHASGGAGDRIPGRAAPGLCLNILNGGRHAYTNPVLSDFPEYLLVARSREVDPVVAAGNALHSAFRERLRRVPTAVVGGNVVGRVGAAADNRAVVEFALAVRDDLGHADDFDLMVDVSAGDLWTGTGYRTALTDGRERSSEEMVEHLVGLVTDYPIRFLEDPLHEEDLAGWTALSAAVRGRTQVIGDNFYSTNAARIRRGAADGHAHGAVIKPNQAGTVSAARAAVAAARETGQVTIASHRSVSTESTFLSWLAVADGLDHIKIGPLATDYSAVVRLNEIIRLTQETK